MLFLPGSGAQAYGFPCAGSDDGAPGGGARLIERVFEAGVDLRRAAGFDDSPPLAVLRHAFMPYETLAGIYSQAARLAWKRAPFHPHPNRLALQSRADGPPLESGDDS